MNIKHTASVEAVRLSIEWVDNMAKSKHNMPLDNKIYFRVNKFNVVHSKYNSINK